MLRPGRKLYSILLLIPPGPGEQRLRKVPGAVSNPRSVNDPLNAGEDKEGNGKESPPSIVEVYASTNSSAS